MKCYCKCHDTACNCTILRPEDHAPQPAPERWKVCFKCTHHSDVVTPYCVCECHGSSPDAAVEKFIEAIVQDYCPYFYDTEKYTAMKRLQSRLRELVKLAREK